jgi:predicted nucleic acid-binding protein
MAKVVVDTDVLIDFTRGREYAALLLRSLPDENRCTTVINQMELLQGASLDYSRRMRKKHVWTRIYTDEH